ncbi:MAG: PAS domain-containing sensor histidine kinase [Methanoregula sp.]|nr:PAS domain-containing sensor histidine kinase [Methanoregula sp.]
MMDNPKIPLGRRSPDSFRDAFIAPEEPFGIRGIYWKGGLIAFSLFLMVSTVFVLNAGGSASATGNLYIVPAILFAYFYRRRGVLAAYLLSMFYLAVVIVFRYPSADDLVAAAIRSALMVAIALTVSYLTHNLILEKRKYQAIFDNTENGVLVLDLEDHSILEMNQRFAHSAGLPSPFIGGSDISVFIHDPDVTDRLFDSLMSESSTPALETPVYRYDGTTWTAIIVARRISVRHAVLTFIDITGRKEMDDLLKRMHREANLYLDILTHDINNINTASLNYGRLLSTPEGGERAGLVANLVRSLEKCDEIIRNVSTLRKIREGSPPLVPVSLDPLIRREIAGFPVAEIEYPGTDATVLADDMLSSVFNNLIGNAVKFQGADPVITISVEDHKNHVSVSIADSGKGIPDSLKPHLFERLQHGDMPASGKGLGLYISRTLIERYGGTIVAEDRVPDEPGRGACIRFTLRKP